MATEIQVYKDKLERLVKEYVEDALESEDPKPTSLSERALDFATYIVLRAKDPDDSIHT